MSDVASAAEFVVRRLDQDKRNGRVEIAMAGEVKTGDLDRLKAVLEPIDAERDGFPYDDLVKLYLNSPGGNYVEGLKIASYIRSKGLATRVKSGGSCYSACALIFMHGTAVTPDQEEYLDRKIEIGARVGFHAPYIVVSKDLNLNEEETRGLIQTAYSAALNQFSSLLESGNKILSTELLIRMLRTPPDQTINVNTWGDLMMWNISLSDPPPMTKLTFDQIKMGCLNAFDQDQNKRPSTTFAELENDFGYMKPKLYKKLPNGGEWYQVMMEDYTGATCNLKVTKSDKGLDIRHLGVSYGNEQMPTDDTPGAVLSYEYFQEGTAIIMGP